MEDKMKKKFLVVLAIAFGTIFACAGGDGSQSALSSDCFEYELLDDGTISINIKNNAPYSFTVPSEVEGSKVSMVKYLHENHRQGGHGTIKIPEGLEIICLADHYDKYEEYLSIKTLILPESVKRYAITISNVEKLVLPKKVKYNFTSVMRNVCALYDPQAEELVIDHSGAELLVSIAGNNTKTKNIVITEPELILSGEIKVVLRGNGLPLSLQKCVKELQAPKNK